ncbi:MAG: signal recognition particle receptor subunit alpha, partial [Roseovarius sp.]|nr:signal recognition particle receptor subunit alpha [Roseovarius sp.]
MALFSKLKERLFKSSSRLGQGLDAIVEEGAEAVPPDAPAADAATAEPAKASRGAEAATPPAAPMADPVPMPEGEERADRPGLLGRVLGRGSEPRRTLDDEMLESLEELLIAADMGVDTALRVTANMAEGRMGRRLSTREIKELLAAEIARIMEPVARPMPVYARRPQVVLVVGVNGSGKTTT